MNKRQGKMARLALLATVGLAIASAPLGARALPFDHVTVGSGVDGLGNRLSIVAYDNAAGGGAGTAFVRLANQPGPGATVVLTCVVTRFVPAHQTFASGLGSDGKRYFIGVFDDTRPLYRGPYDVIAISTAASSGPCGGPGGYPGGWDPVSVGEYVVGP